MKSILTLLIMLVIVFGLTVSANAALVDNGDGTITQYRDDGIVFMWLQDANYAMTSNYYNADSLGRMTWEESMTWATTLVYAGFDDWRLPSSLNSDGSGPCFGFNCDDSEMGHLLYVESVNYSNPRFFDNLQAINYWSDTDYAPDSSLAWDFNFNNGYQNAYYKTADNRYAWAVRVVPEPISSILFITGGSLLAGRRYIKRKNKA